MIEKVFDFFREFSKIPHGSGNTKMISDYLVDFAKKRGLKYYQDELNNVIIIKEAAKGLENAPAVIIQGHMDMVCAKADGCTKDMAIEPIEILSDGEYLYARDTTLGGDDGIAIAYALALLDSEEAYPRLEVVITVDEEIGLLGASYIDLSMLKGKIMLNIDSEAEGIFTAGCAGGLTQKATLSLSRSKKAFNAFTLTLSGLCGGHSGMDINKGRLNANKIMGELLANRDLQIVSINGGSADNAIPSFCTAVVTGDISGISIEKYKAIEPGMALDITPAGELKPFNDESTQKIIGLINSLPNGIQAMYDESLVKTSLNLGVITTKDDSLTLAFSLRSSSDEEKTALSKRVEEISRGFGATTCVSGEYCGWEYREKSPLRDLVIKTYYDMYKKMPKTDVIHAGLECGILSSKIPDLDCISYGPDLLDIHTPRERLNIKSAERVWNFTKALIKGVI